MCIDLYSGLGGWAEGFLAEGWTVIGFDIERHDYGAGVYPGQLVIQDVTTLHGSQFRNADCIVASPPCQAYSWRAMPWKVARALSPTEAGVAEPSWWKLPEYRKNSKIPCMGLQDMAEWAIYRSKHPRPAPSNELFDACFRIQREACEAAGRHIPLIVENVRGAQPWVGRSKYNYGAFHLWGDVPALMPSASKPQKNGEFGGGSWFAVGSPGQKVTGMNPDGRKVPGLNFHEHEKTGKPGRSFQSAAVEARKQPVWFNDDTRRDGNKCGGDWYGSGENCSLMRSMSSKSSARKRASAEIAKIPFALANWIARCYLPQPQERIA